MQQNTENQFESFENKKTISRRALLPFWIKFFCWLFMLLGVGAVGCFIMGLFGVSADLALYGFETNRPLSLSGQFIIILAVFKGFTAYSLWFEKDNAVLLGKIDATIGIVVCLIAMMGFPFLQDYSHSDLRIELLFLIPFYVKLNKITAKWNN